MTRHRPEPQRPPAKKLTPEVVRANPLLAALARQRLREAKAARSAQLPLLNKLPRRPSGD